MIATWRSHRACWMLVALAGCADGSDEACHSIGRRGGLARSVDQVLTIAIYPEALDETVDLCISPSEAPPMVAGPAYRVKPSVPLHFAATVTYRAVLPSDTSEINVGRIDSDAFADGKGQWRSLGGCRVEPTQQLVRCVDDELAAFYGLLDEQIGNTSIADSIGESEVTTDDTSAMTMTTSMTTTMSSTTDTGDTEDPIDYPPECDTLFTGPYDVVDRGTPFMAVAPDNGPEDIAMDGNGGFVGRSGNSLRRVDIATFDFEPLANAPSFDTTTLGLRYAANGDLVMLQRADNAIDVMHADGTVDRIIDNLGLPNALFIDTTGVLWYSEFTAGTVSRWDMAGGGQPVVVGNVSGANGVIYDPLRAMVFFVGYNDGQLWRAPIAADGTAQAAVMVADLTGNSDGVAMDVCGNLYVVDQGGAGGLDTADNTSRLDRVFMDDAGTLASIEEIATFPNSQIANVVFGDGDNSSTVFLVGLPGAMFSIDLQIDGATTPTTP